MEICWEKKKGGGIALHVTIENKTMKEIGELVFARFASGVSI